MAETSSNPDEREALAAWVHRAFADVRLENGMSLHQAGAAEGWEPADVIRKARQLDDEERWQDIPDWKVQEFGHCLGFLDPMGLRFYLPRFMVYSLHVAKHDAHHAEFAAVDALNPQSVNPMRTDMFASLSEEQQRVIAAFLEYVRRSGTSDREENYEANSARAALRKFWRKFL